ncbi:MAG: hypothetical protein ACFE9C_18635 [Candidatus Hodarchaeota archaeon]
MGKQAPSKIYKLYKQKKINQTRLIEDLLTICEHSDSKSTRLECIEIIELEGEKTESIFKSFEEMALSDTDMDVRIKATEYLIKKFPEKGLFLIKYLIEQSISLEFVIRLCKVIGETTFTIKEELANEYFNYLKQVIMQILELEDTSSFELLWGSWFNNTPRNFWKFLADLENPIGFLEILESNLDNKEIFSWIYNSLFTQFNTTHWIFFFNNPKFSGHLFNIIKYLEEENPPQRFFQIIEFFTNISKILTNGQQDRILEILRKNNLFDLALLVVFNWFDYFEKEKLRDLFKDLNYNLNLKLSEIIRSDRFGFLTHDNFFYGLIGFLYRIYDEFDKNYLYQLFDHFDSEFREIFLSKLFEMVNSSENDQLPIRIKFYKNYSILAYKVLKNLLDHYDLKKNLCNQL